MVDTFDNLSVIKWLGEKIVGAGPDGVEYSLWGAIVREDNHSGSGALAADFLDEPLSVDVWQRQIGKNQVEWLAVYLHESPGSGGRRDGVAATIVGYELL